MESVTTAFILPSFPNLTGTFYVNEIVEVGKRVGTMVLALERGKESQTGMELLADRVTYLDEGPSGCYGLLVTHAGAFVRRPIGYLRAAVWAMHGREYGMLKRFRRLPVWAARMREAKATHIHAHFADYATEAALMLSLLTGVPFSFTAHAYDIFVAPRLMTEKICEARFVVTCTQYNRQYILERFWKGPQEKVICLYHGIYLDRFAPPMRRAGGAFKILCVGRMVEKKGMPFLLKACSILMKAKVEFELTLVGDGPQRPELEALSSELGLGRHVTFTGALRHEELIPLYRSADCFCLPSFQTETGDRDGIPNVVPEAMSMELPVISTDVSGIPELLEDGVTGMVVPQKSVEPIAACLKKLARDPELRRRLGQNARTRIVEVFDVRKTGETLANLFVGNGRRS